jgi:amidohydrolase
MTAVAADVRDLTPGVIGLRQELHQFPELAFHEVRTAATLASRMRALGLTVVEGIGGTGVLALLEGARFGPTLLVRADIDGLPMEDTTGRPYTSRVPNRNHACGHDAHAAIIVGVAEVLSRHRARLAGRVAFVFQPADEPMRGARRMIEAGLLERVQPAMSVALHVLPLARAGQVVVQRGPLWASRDELTLTIAAPPREGGPFGAVDLARVAARLTTALYDLVDLEGVSSEPVTFRVRSLRAEQEGPAWLGGTRGEPDGAALEVNLALYDNALRARLLERIAEVSAALVGAVGGTLDIRVNYALPALVNDDHVTGAVERAATTVVGPGNVLTGWRNPFSDDFGLFMAAAPGCLLLLGTANPDKGITEIWHRSGFDIDEDALPVGVHIMALAVLDLLRD